MISSRATSTTSVRWACGFGHKLPYFDRIAATWVISALKRSKPNRFLHSSPEPVRTPTRWFETYTVLAGLYQYAISRGFTTKSPLPVNLPQRPPPFAAYVYTVDELERLLAATDLLQSVLSPMLALTMVTTLLLLYGTGMRIGETLSARFLQDVDLGEHMITVRDTKFFKTRLVPIGPRLAKALQHYHSCRCTLPLPAGAN